MLQLTVGLIFPAGSFTKSLIAVRKLDLRTMTPIFGRLSLLFRGIQTRGARVSYRKTTAAIFCAEIDRGNNGLGIFLNRSVLLLRLLGHNGDSLLFGTILGPHSILLLGDGRRGHVVRTHEYCSFQLDRKVLYHFQVYYVKV